MNDDRILSAEDAVTASVNRLFRSHEALRARLADEIEACAGQIARAEMAEARLARSEEERARVEANLSARLADTEAERDQAERRVRVREDQVGIWKSLLYQRIATIEARAERAEAALRESLVMLDEFIPHVTASWSPHADRLFRDRLAAARAALGEQEPLTGDCETDCQERCAHPGFSECTIGGNDE